MKKAKKVLACLLAFAMMLAMLVGCGAKSAAPAAAAPDADYVPGEQPVTIRFSWWGGDGRHEATQKAVDAFMEKYPNITVNTEFGAWSGWEEKAANQVMTDTAPDLMQINWNWISAYSADGSAFSDLNLYSDLIDLTQWSAEQLDQCKIGDSLQAVPIAMSGRIFYWNETTFEKAGLSVPKTFEELMAAGKVFQDKLGDEYYPLSLGEYDRVFFLVNYLESKYGRNWVDDGKLNYSVEEIAEGLSVLQDMEAQHVIPTIKKLTGDGADSLDKNQNWIDGKYAGILEWDSSAGKFVSAAADSNIVVGEFFPDMGDSHGGFTKVSMGFAIPSGSEHPKEAALLMNFLLNEAEGVVPMGSERGIPASAAGLKICEENSLLDPKVQEANGKVMEWCQFTIDPTFEDSALKSNPDGAYYKVMSKLSYGEIDAQQAAQELTDAIVALQG